MTGHAHTLASDCGDPGGFSVENRRTALLELGLNTLQSIDCEAEAGFVSFQEDVAATRGQLDRVERAAAQFVRELRV